VLADPLGFRQSPCTRVCQALRNSLADCARQSSRLVTVAALPTVGSPPGPPSPLDAGTTPTGETSPHQGNCPGSLASSHCRTPHRVRLLRTS